MLNLPQIPSDYFEIIRTPTSPITSFHITNSFFPRKKNIIPHSFHINSPKNRKIQNYETCLNLKSDEIQKTLNSFKNDKKKIIIGEKGKNILEELEKLKIFLKESKDKFECENFYNKIWNFFTNNLHFLETELEFHSKNLVFSRKELTNLFKQKNIYKEKVCDLKFQIEQKKYSNTPSQNNLNNINQKTSQKLLEITKYMEKIILNQEETNKFNNFFNLIEELSMEIKKLKNFIESKEMIISKILKTMKILNNEKINFLKENLKNGKIFGSKTLDWNMIELKKLGIQEIEQYLPDFLDIESKEFLIKKVKKVEKIEEFKVLIKTLKESFQEAKQTVNMKKFIPEIIKEIKINENSFYINTENSIIDKNCNEKLVKYIDLDNPLKSKHSLNDFQYKEAKQKINSFIFTSKNSIKKLQQSQTFLEYSSKNDITFFNNNIPLNLFSSKEELLNQINDFENKLKTIMKSLNLLENKEFSRLIKEFNFKNYSQKFNISKKELFTLIFSKTLILQFSNK